MLRALKYFLKGQYQPGGDPDVFYKKWYREKSDRKPVRKVIFMCDGRFPHGGLSDRLKGCLSTYKMCRWLHKPFAINWNAPFKLTDYLVPNKIDWTISEEEICYDPGQSLPVFVYWNSLDRKWPKTLDTLKFLLFLNTNKRQKHVYSNTSLVSRGGLSDLYRKLFKPAPTLEKEISRHKVQLGENYESYSFRFQQLLGDFEDCMTKPLEEAAAKELIERCGEKLVELINRQPAGTRALVASDSMRFIEYAQSLDSRIYVIPGAISHVDAKSDSPKSDTWLKTFLDQHMIMGARTVHLLRTGQMYNSGFPAFAASVGGRPYIIHEF